MKRQRLPREDLLGALEALREHISPNDFGRLTAIAGQAREDGLVGFRAALDAGGFAGTKDPSDTFRKFRTKIARSAKAARAGVILAADDNKSSGADLRFVWFEGEPRTPRLAVSMSAQVVTRGSFEKAVAPEGVDLRPTLRVFVEHDGSVPRRARVLELIDALTAQLKVCLQPGMEVEVVNGAEPPAGADRAAWAEQARHADAVVTLISPGWLAQDRRAQASCPHRHLSATMVTVVDSAGVPEVVKPTILASTQLAHAQPQERDKLAAEVARNIAQMQGLRCEQCGDPPATVKLSAVAAEAARTVSSRRRGLDPAELVLPDGYPYALEGAVPAEEPPRRRGGPRLNLVDALTSWALGAAGPAQCALLGDSGSGKTTTAKLLTKRLLAAYEQDPTSPLPIHLDLRDLDTAELPPAVNLEGILDRLLFSLDLPGGRLTGAEVMTLARERRCVVILDGLDEVLGQLEPKVAERIMRVLWRFLTDAGIDDSDDGVGTRLLATCRTHYFRSAAEESRRFTGHEREGRRPGDFLAFEMAELSDEQIASYLTLNVPQVDPDEALALFGRIHDLSDLARRPMLLRLLTDHLDEVAAFGDPGRNVTTAVIYEALVGSWLARDESKHQLLPEHKLLLMEDLAAHLVATGQRGISADEAETRMLQFLHDRPELELHYAQRAPAVWKEDLRTATFIVRSPDDRYAFAHTSLREYFHARSLARALHSEDGDARGAWAGISPTRETWVFVGQLLQLAEPTRRARMVRTLERVAQGEDSAALATFHFGLVAAESGLPHHHLGASRLRGADLSDVRIGQSGHHEVDLTGLVAVGCSFRRSRWRRVILDQAIFTGCALTQMRLEGSSVTGSVLRDCALDGLVLRDCVGAWSLEGGTTHRLQLVRSDAPLSGLPRDAYRAPVERGPGRDARLHAFAGETGSVLSVAWSPDGARVVSGGDDGSVRVWDAGSGQEVARFTGHTGWVRSVGWSPDGARVVSGGHDGSARVWDAGTGQEVARFTNHTGPVWSVGWSPDGARVVSGGRDGSVRVWDAVTGQEVARFAGHTGWVRSVGWNPKDALVVSGGDDGSVRVWHAVTGQEEARFTSYTGPVWSVGWSPDGARVVSGGDDASVRVWDAVTGQEVARFTSYTGPVRSVGWSPDGARVVSGGDGSVRVWEPDASPESVWLVELLDEQEWALFDGATGELRLATAGAWAYLGWQRPGTDERLPAESYGPLPLVGGTD